MTLALKDVGQISSLLGVSPLSRSSMWTQPVNTIQPAQFIAFIDRFNELGQRDMAETAIDLAQSEVQRAVTRGEFDAPAMLMYQRPLRTYLTAGDLKRGLEYCGEPHASAIVFALETGLDALGVAMLTHKRLALMTELSDIAKACLDECPQNLHSPYVFWADRGDSIVLPCFSLDHTVFEAFGLVWGELAFGYRHLIMTDSEADRESVECYLKR